MRANFSCDLTNALTVGASNFNLSRCRRFNIDTFGYRENDIMR